MQTIDRTIADRMRGWAAELSGASVLEAPDDASLAELGLDSVGVLSLLARLFEEEHINPEEMALDFQELTTLSDLFRAASHLVTSERAQ